MHSAIYHGWVKHRRYAPRRHQFSYPLFLMFLDLSELDQVFKGRWFWSCKRWALARFDRKDHFGDPEQPLDEAVRQFVERETGRRPRGAVRLLTHLRYFGYCFNPVSFYYIFRPDESGLECIVAEVNNTPWAERHCYLLNEPSASDHNRFYRFRSAKVLHVSPFMPMNLNYEWRFSPPGESLIVQMSLQQSEPTLEQVQEARIFDAMLNLKRNSISRRRLASVLFKYPLMTLQVITAIHWEALKLWIKRVPVHQHPAKSE